MTGNYAVNWTGGGQVTVTKTGEVFTKRWVVELMLDMAGYTGNVTGLRVVEPSVGSGAFIGPIVERLVAANPRWETLHDAVRGYDLREDHIEASKALVRSILVSAGCPIADELVDAWLHVGDFLLTDLPDADLVVGNPPYIRADNLDPALLAAYRHACPTMTRRADIFVGFFERGLDILMPGGRLVYICADRWMRNGYGQDLRAKVVREFAVDDVLVMHDSDAFDDKVSAYPAIVNLRRGTQGRVNVATASETFGDAAAADFLRWRDSSEPDHQNTDVQAARMEHWHTTSAVWPDGTPDDLAWLATLDHFPRIEAAGVKLGIGIATGADKVYIQRQADVEPDRLVPMVTPADIKGPGFVWTGEHLVSPWQGRSLVDISAYPKLLRFYERFGEKLRGRNVAKRSAHWWRTIDSFNPALLERDLIVMQDMKVQAHPVRVPAGYYPHHGLTWFSSDTWDLDVLGGLLMSEPVERQVAACCVRMRGGTLRFQPTVMRMVRIPRPESIPAEVAEALSAAFRAHDRLAATVAAWRLFPTR
jgi:possible site-specific DNA-methyltransferase (adenine-specific)